MSNIDLKTVNIDNLKQFANELLPKYITNKDILDKLSLNNNSNLQYDGTNITKINDETLSDNTTYSSNKITNFIKDYVSNINANFLSEEGYGGIRYYNNIFEYYDSSASAWREIDMSGDVYQLGIQPKDMTSCTALTFAKEKTIKLRFTPPTNTVIEDQIIAAVGGIRIIRKVDSPPTGIRDSGAKFVATIKSSQFKDYNGVWFDDPLGDFEEGKTYYYGFFPYSTTSNWNQNINNNNICKAEYHTDYTVFEFTIDQTESDPSKMITYGGANENFTPAHMDYDKDEFDYGDWTVENGAWFMDVKPCMLKYDGTVDYYLDPNDYSKKITGEDSDWANALYDGNCMVEFPRTYIKEILYEDNPDKVTYQLSNEKIDDDFKCYAHTNVKGEEVPFIYISPFWCRFDGLKSRSISYYGDTNNYNDPFNTTTTYSLAKMLDGIIANNKDKTYYMEQYADRMLIDKLLILIGRNTNMTAIFGGIAYKYYSSDVQCPYCGAQAYYNKKGLFYGKKYIARSNAYPPVVFGLENYYGSQFNYMIDGFVYTSNYVTTDNISNTEDGIYIKMHCSAESKLKSETIKNTYVDISDYTYTGIDLSNKATSANSSYYNGYVDKMKFTNQCILPIQYKGSSSTYYCDALVMNRYSSDSDTIHHSYLLGIQMGTANAESKKYNINNNSYVPNTMMNNTNSTSYLNKVRMTCKPILKAVEE